MKFLLVIALIAFIYGAPAKADSDSVCKDNEGRVAHEGQCQLYWDCSRKRDFVDKFFEEHLFECEHPLQFNEKTLECEMFDKVQCGSRLDVKYKCDYLAQQCGTSHCRPCSIDHPPCVDKPDGNYSLLSIKGMPFHYYVCNTERNMGTKFCGTDNQKRPLVFNPETGLCEEGNWKK